MLSVQGLLIMFLLGILVNILYEGIKTEIKNFRYRKQYEKRLKAVDTTGLNLYQVFCGSAKNLSEFRIKKF